MILSCSDSSFSGRQEGRGKDGKFVRMRREKLHFSSLFRLVSSLRRETLSLLYLSLLTKDIFRAKGENSRLSYVLMTTTTQNNTTRSSARGEEIEERMRWRNKMVPAKRERKSANLALPKITSVFCLGRGEREVSK